MQLLDDLCQLGLEIEVHICGHLVITGTGCVEFARYWTNFFCQKTFHIHVDVLVGNIKLQLSCLIFGQQLFQSSLDLVCFLLADDAGLPQHGHMGNGALEVKFSHLLVEGDGGSKLLYPFFQTGFKPATP